MSRPFKLRYVSEITGFFVLVCTVLLLAGIYLAGKAQGWFEQKLVLHAVFTTHEGAFGLRKGSEVKILKAHAGTVTDIAPNPDGDIEATFVLQSAYQRYVRTDSTALVKKKFEIAGDAFVEILPGSRDNPMMASGAIIECRKDTEIIKIAMAALDDLRTVSLPAINQLRMALDELPSLTIQLQETLHETEKLLEGLQNHWLLRKYVEHNEMSYLIAPSEVGAMKGDRE